MAMASSPQLSVPWIEDTFSYAASFRLNAARDAQDQEHEKKDDSTQQEHDKNTPLPSDGGEVANTIGAARPATSNTTIPSRESKVVHVVERGGDFCHYKTRNGGEGGGSSSSCPPYLILHDGKHSALAFLSPDTMASLMSNGGDNDEKVPSMKNSFIEISHYAVSTILQCTSIDLSVHEKVLQDYTCHSARIPPRQSPRHQIDHQLYMCLYLQTPISFVDAEDRATKCNTVDLHTSASLRSALIDLQKKYHKNADRFEEEGHCHHRLIQRLEACYCYCVLKAKDEQAPLWPWESRLVLADQEDGTSENNDVCVVKQEDMGNDEQQVPANSFDVAVKDEPSSGNTSGEIMSESSSGGNTDEENLDIVELVNAIPDLRSDPRGGNYTEDELALVDQIRNETSQLRALKEKLTRSYLSKVRCGVANNLGEESASGQISEEAPGREETVTRGAAREASKRLKSERAEGAETSLARNRPRRSLSTTGREEACGEAGGGGGTSGDGRGGGNDRGRVKIIRGGGREGGAGRAKRNHADITPKGMKEDIRQQKKTKHSICKKEGCTTFAQQGGLCVKHGAKVKYPRCKVEGCTKQVQNGGVCRRHGAKPIKCSRKGCTNQVQSGGVCRRHGAKTKGCSREGCPNRALTGGVCARHGAVYCIPICNREGCAKVVQQGGVCIEHGAKTKRCERRGCTKKAMRGGVCVGHGAWQPPCSREGCNNNAVQGGVCIRHGAKVRRCNRKGCTKHVKKEGFCLSHYAVYVTSNK